MEDGIGGQLVQLNPINKKKAVEEIVNWGRKAADEVINKTNPILHWRVGVAFFAGKADGVLLLHQAKPLQRVEVLVRDFRCLPFKIFSGHLGLWSTVARESRARWHQWHWRSNVRAYGRSKRVGRRGNCAEESRGTARAEVFEEEEGNLIYRCGEAAEPLDEKRMQQMIPT